MSVNPFWPAVLVGLAVLVLAALRLSGRTRSWGRPAAVSVSPRERRTGWRRVAIGVLVLLAALRPGFGSTLEAGRATDVDVVIMLDRSLSMIAEDYDGTTPRLVGAKADVRLVLERFAGARFAVVTFDHIGRLEMPFTTDTTALMSLVEVAQPRVTYASKGSSIDAGMVTAEEVLRSSAQQFPQRQRVLVYLGDGEQTLPTPPASFGALKTYLSGGLVLGYGTTAGGRMKTGADSYEKDWTKGGKDALSVIHEGNLRAIASQVGGEYVHRTGPGPLTIKASVVRGSGGAGLVTAGDDWSWLLGLLLLGPVLWEMWDAATTGRGVRRLVGRREETA